MKVIVRYGAQSRRAAGCDSEEIENSAPISIEALLGRIAAKNESGLRGLLIDANGKPSKSLLIFVNEEQIRPCAAQLLNDGDPEAPFVDEHAKFEELKAEWLVRMWDEFGYRGGWVSLRDPDSGAIGTSREAVWF